MLNKSTLFEYSIGKCSLHVLDPPCDAFSRTYPERRNQSTVSHLALSFVRKNDADHTIYIAISDFILANIIMNYYEQQSTVFSLNFENKQMSLHILKSRFNYSFINSLKWHPSVWWMFKKIKWYV